MIGKIADDFPTIGLIWLYLIGPHRLPETESLYWEEAALSHFATPGYEPVILEGPLSKDEYCMKNAAEIENMQKMYIYSPDMRHTKFLFIYTLFIHIKCLKKNFYLRMFLIKKFLLFKVSLTVPDVSSFGRERFGNRIFHKTLRLTDI